MQHTAEIAARLQHMACDGADTMLNRGMRGGAGKNGALLAELEDIIGSAIYKRDAADRAREQSFH
jgi:hypothetical protein